jgi:hypothetical protein
VEVVIREKEEEGGRDKERKESKVKAPVTILIVSGPGLVILGNNSLSFPCL